MKDRRRNTVHVQTHRDAINNVRAHVPYDPHGADLEGNDKSHIEL